MDLTIDSVAYRGPGVARHEGMVVFVAGVAPGERVRVRIVKLRRNYAEAQLLAVQESSPDRIPPCCRLPNGARVPGCVYDHLAYPAEVALKQRQAEEFLRRLPGGDALAFAPPFPSPLDRHYRNKIVLHSQRTPRDKLPRLGYFGDDNRTVIDIPACPLARAEINTALADFRRSGDFRRLRDAEAVTFRWTPADGVVWWRGENPQHSHLTEAAPFGAVRVPADGFYQVNPEVAAELVRQVAMWFQEEEPEMAETGGANSASPVSSVPGRARGARHSSSDRDLLDLYCGVGVFAIACAKAGARRVEGIESGRAAIAAATENARAHDVQAAFHCRTMLAAAQDGFGGFVMTRATMLVDPPRQGLEPEVARALAQARPPRLCYVSCDPATLARDLKILLPAGYAPRHTRVFDMFPRTAHFETAVWLVRR